MDLLEFGRASELEEEIRRHRVLYTAGKPEVSDEVFDALVDELRDLDPASEVLQEVGAPVSLVAEADPETTGWQKVQHAEIMGSLQKVHTRKDLDAWLAKMPAGVVLHGSEKADGFAVSHYYERGVLVRSATRGEGLEGEDITRNARLFVGVPDRLPFPITCEIRGEGVLTKRDHERHLPMLKNRRNGVVGIGKAFDPAKSHRCGFVTYLAYDLRGGVTGVTTRTGMWQALGKLGFRTPAWVCGSPDQIASFYDSYAAKDGERESAPYDLDGIVVELDDLGLSEGLGMVGKYPVYGRAWKFAPEQRLGKVRAVTAEMGDSGRCTPVANFLHPIRIGGTDVLRATLHNWDWVATLGIGEGAEVLVARMGDVIPGVVRVVVPGSSVATPPIFCPECDSVLEREHTSKGRGKHLLCTNPLCPSRLQGAISSWISALGVKDFGDTLVGALLRSGKVRDVSDLYRLAPADVESLTREDGARFGESGKTALKNLRAVKEVTLPAFIEGLGIAGIGRSVGESLVDAGLRTWQDVTAADVTRLESIPKIGPSKAHAIRNGVVSRIAVAERILRTGVRIAPPKTGALAGTTVCFTGSRDMISLAESAGARVKGSVTKDLTFLVCEDLAAATGKLEQARRYGTRVLLRAEFLALLDPK